MEVNRVEDVARSDVADDEKPPRRGSDASSINQEALGDELPVGYFRSVRFIGAMTVIVTKKLKIHESS